MNKMHNFTESVIQTMEKRKLKKFKKLSILMAIINQNQTNLMMMKLLKKDKISFKSDLKQHVLGNKHV